jgi:hypothetical protein
MAGLILGLGQALLDSGLGLLPLGCLALLAPPLQPFPPAAPLLAFGRVEFVFLTLGLEPLLPLPTFTGPLFARRALRVDQSRNRTNSGGTRIGLSSARRLAHSLTGRRLAGL